MPAGGPSARRRSPRHADDHLEVGDLVAYALDESSNEIMVHIVGVFHGGQGWEAALGEDQGDPEAGR
jgi:plasmid stabilization system protein ParE